MCLRITGKCRICFIKIEKCLSKYGMTKTGCAKRLGLTLSNLHTIIPDSRFPTAKTRPKNHQANER